jgi:gliding motility-associated-like protein
MEFVYLRYKTWRLVSLLCIGLNLTGFAQITSPTADFVKPASYINDTLRTDYIYIFCSSNGESDGTLLANPPGVIQGCDFEWRKYNQAIFSFDTVFYSEYGVDFSEISGLGSGGYQVRITDGILVDTAFIAWVFIDEPFDSVAILNFTCDYLALKGFAYPDTFKYYDLDDNTQIILENGVNFRWSSDPVSTIPYPTLEINPITYNPPYEDTRYYLSVTDSFGCMNEASLFYESIHVKADFEVDPTSGEAPLEVEFINKSINAIEFEWTFEEDTNAISILENPEPYTYYIPGDFYEVILVAKGEFCIDTFKYQYIVVEPSSLEIPNVFTPNDDTYNDRFVVAGKSLRSLYVQIFSRSGKKVYEFTGHDSELKDWEGWDGKINGKADASPGVYYYIIHAVGWDDVLYKGKLYRGVVHLYREKR